MAIMHILLINSSLCNAIFFLNIIFILILHILSINTNLLNAEMCKWFINHVNISLMSWNVTK